MAMGYLLFKGVILRGYLLFEIPCVVAKTGDTTETLLKEIKPNKHQTVPRQAVA